MVVKDLAQMLSDSVNLFLRFEGDEIIYSPSLAAITDNLVIDHIELESAEQIRAYIKLQPATL